MKRPLTSLALIMVATAVASPAAAQVVLEPNTIQGDVKFTNVDPTIVALLDNQLGFSFAQVNAYSTSPGGYSSNGTFYPSPDPRTVPYVISAESNALNPNPMTYAMQAYGYVYGLGGSGNYGYYYFGQVAGVPLSPNSIDNDGTDQDIAECVGVVRIKWGTDATCTTPVSVNSGYVQTPYTYEQFGSGSTQYVLQPGGQTVNTTLYYLTGTDPTFDTITFAANLTFNPACDQIQDICIDMSGSGAGGQLGAFVGPFDIVGETEQFSTFIDAFNGPNQNRRYNSFVPPEIPISPVSGWWKLPNLVPGAYSLYAQTYVGTGVTQNYVRTPLLSPSSPIGQAVAVSGVDVDLSVAGQYPYIMHPAHMSGDVLLQDPSVITNPGSTSSLSAMNQMLVIANDTVTGYGYSQGGMPFPYTAATGSISTSYSQVLANPYDSTVSWYQPYLVLNFYNPESPTSADYRNGYMYMQHPYTPYNVSPGDNIDIDHAYCFNEVTIGYTTTLGTMYNPVANINGSFVGTDWQSNPANYNVFGGAYGTPTNAGAAATTGTVRFTAPQGTFTLQPSATIVVGGGSSTASFAATTLNLGCGQNSQPVPGLSVSLDQLPPCSDQSGTVTISGQVLSTNGATVDSIYYTVNGGAPIVICPSNCGVNPTFSALAALADCVNTIQVFATSSQVAGIPAVSQQITYDDFTDNTICGNGECGPPVTCGNGVLDAGEQCDDGNTMSGDGCDAGCMTECVDSDGDTICDPVDNCVNIYNPSQADSDNDGVGDACDATCVTLTDIGDSTLTSNSPTTNYGTVVGMRYGLIGTVSRETLIRFDHTSVPAGAVVVSGTLHLSQISITGVPGSSFNLALAQSTTPLWSENLVTWGNFGAPNSGTNIGMSVNAAAPGPLNVSLTTSFPIGALDDGLVLTQGFGSTLVKTKESGAGAPTLDICYVVLE